MFGLLFSFYLAGKWLLSQVNPFMLLQILTIAECHATIGAEKWLLSCVGSFMSIQSATPIKCFVTLEAGEWLLSCHSLLF